MRRKNSSYKVLILLLIVVIGVGYSLISASFNITGKTVIGKSSWGLMFRDVYITTGSIEAYKEPTIENDTTVNFEVVFWTPGDFYEFTVDIYNNGTIDAMIDSVEKTLDLTEEQKKILNYTIEYQNNESITTKQLVSVDSFVRLKVRIDYKKDIEVSDLPNDAIRLKLGLKVNYVQSDESGVQVTDNGIDKAAFSIISGDLDTPGSEFCLGEECFYILKSNEDEIEALTKYNLLIGYKTTDFDGNNSDKERLSNPSGIQSPLALCIDYNQENDTYNLPFYGCIYYATNSQLEYENSSIKEYIDKYARYIYNIGYYSDNQFILSKSDLESFECDIEANTCIGTNYPWIYSTTYWLEDYTGSYTKYVMKKDGSIEKLSTTEIIAGVRPVLVFKKNVLSN